MITSEQLIAIAPTTNKKILNDYLPLINKVIDEKNLTNDQVSKFLAQILHESLDFKCKEENLNYSSQGLLTIFGKYFDKDSAKLYARQPQKIANRVYANRMKNSDEQSGDGWAYRGRGLVQLTGKENYENFAKDHNMTLDQCVHFLSTTDGSFEVCVWFFDKNKLWDLEIKTQTRKINGGNNGLGDRIRKYEKILKVLNQS